MSLSSRHWRELRSSHTEEQPLQEPGGLRKLRDQRRLVWLKHRLSLEEQGKGQGTGKRGQAAAGLSVLQALGMLTQPDLTQVVIYLGFSPSPGTERDTRMKSS